MLRKAFRMSVDPGQYEEYERRHNELWPEMEEVLRSHGAHNYSIFLDKSDGSLFGYVEIENDVLWDAVAGTAVCQRWWHYMSDIMPTNDDESPQSVDLREVFHLE